MRSIALMTFALALPVLSAQTTPQRFDVDVRDASASGAPVVFSGAIKCSEWTDAKEFRVMTEGSVQGVNISKREIIAMITAVKFNCPDAPLSGNLEVDDHFFRDHGMVAETFTIPINQNEGTSPTGASPAATVELVFVQFDDDSFWGDKNAAADMLKERADVKTLLKRLSLASSEAAFSEILAENQPPSTSAEHRSISA